MILVVPRHDATCLTPILFTTRRFSTATSARRIFRLLLAQLMPQAWGARAASNQSLAPALARSATSLFMPGGLHSSHTSSC